MKLDEKRRQAECDGRIGSERYFRCPPGFGVFLPMDDVEVLTKGISHRLSLVLKLAAGRVHSGLRCVRAAMIIAV